MKLPNPRTIRIAGLTRGAIIEGGDAEFILSPVLQLNIDLPSPLNKVTGTGSVVDDSVFTSAAVQRAGVGAAATTVLANFNRGAWKMYINFQAQFNGTSTPANFSALQLQDPDGVLTNIMVMSHLNNQFIAQSLILPFVFQRDSFLIQVVGGTTVALDNLGVNASLYGTREI